MDWHQDFTVVDGTLYAQDRWLGSFSSHAAALAAINLMRGSRALQMFSPSKSFAEYCSTLSSDDLDLIEAIDHDEV